MVVRGQNDVHNAPVNDRVDTPRQTNLDTLDDGHANDNHKVSFINVVGPLAVEINMASVGTQILFLVTIVFLTF